jgi:cell division protein FtsL
MSRHSNSHIPKSGAEKRYYNDFIKSQDYVPTVDESLKFSETTDEQNEFKVEKNKKPRKKSFKEQISDHFGEHWIYYVIGVVTIVISFLMIDSKVDIARIFEKNSTIEKNIETISTDIKELDKKITDDIDELKETNHDQDMKIQENSLKIEYSKEKKNGK